MTTCPKCGAADQIRKVSAICATDTSVSTSKSNTAAVGVTLQGQIGIGGARTSTSGQQQTLLGHKLAPPSRPSQEHGSPRTGGWFLTIVGGACILTPLLNFLSPTLSSDAKTAVVVFPLLGAVLLVAGLRTLRIATANETTWRANFEDRLAAWTRATEKWNRTYYCFRDDIVFDPESGDSAPVDSFATYLVINSSRSRPA